MFSRAGYGTQKSLSGPPTKAARWALPTLMMVGAAVFLSGINWGLPSRAADPFLFGDRQPWNGKTILNLAGGWDGRGVQGADMDANPLVGRDQPITLNATDAQRAEIVRRYRLYSYQPDEMNTLKALARMRPGAGDLDPRLYQYGGLWFYPLGALIKVASILHLIDLRGGTDGLAYYLDHPEAFGRFYVVARCYSAAWGVVGICAVWRIAWRMTRSTWASTAAGAAFIVMPIVINMSHEAKPHLGGAVLCLLALLAADRYIESGARRWWMSAGALCGASLAMVLTMLPVLSILVGMAFLRHRDSVGTFVRVFVFSAAIGGGVYAISNPYVALHLMGDRSVVLANLGNTATNMYVRPSVAGLFNAAWLTCEGAGAPFGVLGCVAAGVGVVLGAKRLLGRGVVNRPDADMIGLLLALPALLIALQAALFATGKPAEFGRFLLLPDIALMLGSIWLFARTTGDSRLPAPLAVPIIAIIVIATALPGWSYLHNFILDSRPVTPRLAEAAQLRARSKDPVHFGARAIGIPAEPAPYDLPPVNLFECELVLLPLGWDDLSAARRVDLIVEPTDARFHRDPTSPFPDVAPPVGAVAPRTPISWAAKSFRIRENLVPPSTISGVD